MDTDIKQRKGKNMVNEDYDVELDDTEYDDVEEPEEQEEFEEDSGIDDIEQQNTRAITGQDMHDLFCEAMGCEEASWLRIVSLDDMEYYNKTEKEEVSFDLPSFYKKDGNNVNMFVNVDELNSQPFRCIEILFSQLFELYAPTIDFYRQAEFESEKMRIIQGKFAEEGYHTWFEFMNSLVALQIMKENIEYVAIADEYQSDKLIERYESILKSATNQDNETVYSIIIYVLGKLAYMEPTSKVKNMAGLKKLKFRDITKLFDGDTGIKANEMYELMMISMYRPLTYFEYVKLGKLSSAIKSEIINPENTGNRRRRDK